MPSIAQQQNTPENLRLLAAQSRLYTQAKQMRRVRLFSSIVLTAASPFILLLLPDSALVMAGMGAVLAVITEGFLKNVEEEKIRQAATVQEQFDTSLFGLPWNETLVGRRVSPEIIHGANRGFTGNRQGLINWYADTGSLPHPFDVLLCQRANVVWDWRLRRRYAWAITFVMVAVFIIGVLFAIAMHQTFINAFLALFVPSLPALLLGIETVRLHHKTAAEKEEIEEKIAALWENSLKDPTSVTVDRCRQIQDCIYSLRKAGPLVPDRWYQWLRNQYQFDMESTVAGFKAEAERALARKGH